MFRKVFWEEKKCEHAKIFEIKNIILGLHPPLVLGRELRLHHSATPAKHFGCLSKPWVLVEYWVRFLNQFFYFLLPIALYKHLNLFQVKLKIVFLTFFSWFLTVSELFIIFKICAHRQLPFLGYKYEKFYLAYLFETFSNWARVLKFWV